MSSIEPLPIKRPSYLLSDLNEFCEFYKQTPEILDPEILSRIFTDIPSMNSDQKMQILEVFLRISQFYPEFPEQCFNFIPILLSQIPKGNFDIGSVNIISFLMTPFSTKQLIENQLFLESIEIISNSIPNDESYLFPFCHIFINMLRINPEVSGKFIPFLVESFRGLFERSDLNQQLILLKTMRIICQITSSFPINLVEMIVNTTKEEALSKQSFKLLLSISSLDDDYSDIMLRSGFAEFLNPELIQRFSPALVLPILLNFSYCSSDEIISFVSSPDFVSYVLHCASNLSYREQNLACRVICSLSQISSIELSVRSNFIPILIEHLADQQDNELSRDIMRSLQLLFDSCEEIAINELTPNYVLSLFEENGILSVLEDLDFDDEETIQLKDDLYSSIISGLRINSFVE